MRAPPLVIAIAEASIDAVAVTDTEQRLIHFNRPFARLVGLRERELREGHAGVCHSLLALESCKDGGCLARRVVASKKPQRLHEVKAGRNDLVVIQSAVPLVSETGEVTAVMETFKDVTAEARMQARYRELLDAERKRSEALEREVELRETQLDSSQKELEEVRSQLLGIFREEARELCEQLSADVIALGQTQASEREELSRRVLRQSHTLKGTAASIGLEEVSRVAHSFESRIALALDEPTPFPRGLVDRLLGALDEISSYIEALVAGESDTGRGLLRAEKMLESEAPDPDPAAIEPPRQRRGAGDSFTRVSTVQLDALGEDLQGIAESLRGSSSTAALAQHIERVRTQLRKLSTVQISTLLEPFRRAVWDHARRVGRDAMLDIRGGDLSLDRTMVEGLRGPLTHLLRNAIDHGIEPPEIRVSKGKPPIGRIVIEARREGPDLVVTVEDDGGGVDVQKIRDAAASQGHGAGLTDEEAMELIWMPRFSTAPEVTETAGRGVGLDAVRDGISRLWGQIDLKTQLGRGTKFRIRVPVPGAAPPPS